MKGILVERDNKLYVMTELAMNDEPILLKLYYPLAYTSTAYEFKMTYGEQRIGKTLTYNRIRGSYQDEDGLWYPLLVGDKTNPEFTERSIIKCPKTRKLIETRYMCGRWEKCTKRDGWIPA